MLLLVLLIAAVWRCNAAPCNPKAQSFVISNAKAAQEFTAAATCTNGKLTADWRVSLTLGKPIAVGKGTQLIVKGNSEEETVISGDGTTQLFTVQTGAALELDSLTLRRGVSAADGLGGAVFLADSSSLKAIRVRFEDNIAADSGGAIYASPKTAVAIERCFFSNSTAEYGAGVLSLGAVLSINDSEFSLNRAFEGAAISCGAAIATITSTVFDSNSADASAGAISLSDGNMTVTGSSFTGNTASTIGGAITHVFGDQQIINCEFTANTASTGGVLYRFSGSTSIADSRFTSNTAAVSGNGISAKTGFDVEPGFGGALALTQGSTTLNNCAFKLNSAAAVGGGISSTFGTVSATGCSFDRNTAVDTGGAVAVVYAFAVAAQKPPPLPPTTGLVRADDHHHRQQQQQKQQQQTEELIVILQLTRCTFAGNTAATGGALYTGENSLIDSCEFSDNSATISGGADYYATGSDDTPTVVVLQNGVYSGNSAATGGATFLDDAVAATVSKCTYGRNQAQAGAAVYCATDSSSAIDACTFSSNGNTLTVTGGAIAAYSHKELNVTGTVFSGGSAIRGAAIHSDRGPVIIQTSAFNKCDATRNGGAVWSSGTTIIASCTYSNNSAGNNGGAVYTSVGGVTLIIADTNFTGNTAVNSGAAVFQFGTQWPMTAIDTSVNFRDNSAGCCHATGYGSSSEWLLATTTTGHSSNSSGDSTTQRSCSDYDTGTGKQCCVLGEYSDGAKCIRCSTLEDFSCTQVGATIGKLMLCYSRFT
jgi:predicted outer membrane repeat protein